MDVHSSICGIDIIFGHLPEVLSAAINLSKISLQKQQTPVEVTTNRQIIHTAIPTS